MAREDVGLKMEGRVDSCGEMTYPKFSRYLPREDIKGGLRLCNSAKT